MAEKRAPSGNEAFDFDLIILGAGSAGISCAKTAARLGVKVACFESADSSESDGIKDSGFDLLRKLMYESALMRDYIQDAICYSFFIPESDRIVLDWKKFVQVMKKHFSDFNQTVNTELKALKIEYFNASGYFIDEHTIGYLVEEEIEKVVTGKFILIAVTGHPIVPDVPGVKLGTTINNILNLKEPPGKTLIVGSNYSCLETATFLNFLQYHTTIISETPMLPELDQQMVGIILDAMSTRGIDVLSSHYVYGTQRSLHGRLSVDYVDESYNQMKNSVFDTIVWSLGYEVDISKYRCEKIGIAVKDNQVIVDKFDRTSIPNIFAIGNICSSGQFSSVLNLAGHLLARRLFLGSKRRLDYADFSATILSVPEYSFIGLTESEAIEKFGEDNVEVYHAFYRPTEYFVPKKSTDHCYAKVITLLEDDDNEPVLGMHYLGPYAGDVIQGFAVAMGCGLTAKILFHTIAIHPTVASELCYVTITKRSELDPNPNIPCS